MFDWLNFLKQYHGYYECPKDKDGKRLGPLVGYAGRDKFGRQYVGDVYANFAKVERNTGALNHVVEALRDVLRKELPVGIVDSATFCGAPEGGKSLALLLAQRLFQPCIYPEKKVLEVATKDSRERSELVFGRHEPEEDELVVVLEDVCNNFSTTNELVNLIEKRGAIVVAIACFLNRSLSVEKHFLVSGKAIPVVALVQKPIMEYEQDHAEVRDDIARGNVILKPKPAASWARLEAAMRG